MFRVRPVARTLTFAYFPYDVFQRFDKFVWQNSPWESKFQGSSRDVLARCKLGYILEYSCRCLSRLVSVGSLEGEQEAKNVGPASVQIIANSEHRVIDLKRICGACRSVPIF